MTVNEKVESYLVTLDYSFERLGNSGWIISNPEQGIENLIVMAEDPVVVLRSTVMAVPASNQLKLFEKLLRLNSSELIHGAYGLDENQVVLIDTINTDSLDFDSFQASLDALGMALSQHLKVLASFR